MDNSNRTHNLLTDPLEISDQEFSQLSALIYHHFGVNLTEAKRGLLVRRLHNILRAQNFQSFGEYYRYLLKNPTDGRFNELVNVITTNYTFFYREPAHFDYFSQTALPEIIEWHQRENNRDLRIWCAAAATGEEPYMLAILMMEKLGHNYGNWDAGLLATDISERALAKAKIGRYLEEEFENMPRNLKANYFRKVGPELYEVVPKLKDEVLYRRFNLINPRYPFQRPFDAIFCRNVMIYFDDETKEKVVKNLHASLRPNGFLFIGHSESIMKHGSYFKYVMPAVYRKI